MESPQHGSPEFAAINTIVSIVSGLFALITINDVQKIGSLFATGIAICSGVMAIRYYWYSIKEKKQNLKNQKPTS